MMEVYHTSNVRVEKPDTQHSRKELDFSPGFYLTHLRSQAEKYSFRFFKRAEDAWLSSYDFSEDWGSWRVKTFDKYDERWFDFVVACRHGEIVGDYDMIETSAKPYPMYDTA